MNQFSETINTLVEQTQAHLYIIFIALGVLWFFFLLTLFTNRNLLILGIYPRQTFGLIGIIFAPLLHGSFNHIFFNSIPFCILSNFILIGGVAFYLNLTFYLVVLSGLLAWLFSRPALHVGASGVITGYWSFLMINAYSNSSVISIILAIVCGYYFAGIFFGIFPFKKGVSWEGHLFGMISGILLNYGYPYLPQLFTV